MKRNKKLTLILKHMKKIFKDQTIILAVLIIILFFSCIWIIVKKNDIKKEPNKEAPIKIAQVLGEKDDFISFNPTPRSIVSGKVEATGIIQGGYFFEGNIIVKVIDATGKELATTHGTAVTDWMTAGPVTFKTTIDFTKLKKGPSYIMLVQDDPSGGENGKKPKKILVPVIIS